MLWGNQSLRELWAVIYHNFSSSSISEKQGEETKARAEQKVFLKGYSGGEGIDWQY